MKLWYCYMLILANFSLHAQLTITDTWFLAKAMKSERLALFIACSPPSPTPLFTTSYTDKNFIQTIISQLLDTTYTAYGCETKSTTPSTRRQTVATGFNLVVGIETVKKGKTMLQELKDLLVAQGTNIDATDPINFDNPTGDTLLITAITYNKPDVAQFLIDRGADINLVNESGWTALMSAALIGNESLVKTLLEHGANTTLTTLSERKTAEQLATQFGYTDIATMIQQWPKTT